MGAASTYTGSTVTCAANTPTPSPTSSPTPSPTSAGSSSKASMSMVTLIVVLLLIIVFGSLLGVCFYWTDTKYCLKENEKKVTKDNDVELQAHEDSQLAAAVPGSAATGPRGA